MPPILDSFAVLGKLASLPVETYGQGELVLAGGSATGKLLIMTEGAVEVVRAGVRIAEIAEPGAVFGDLAVLLDQPHSADVRTLQPSTFRVADGRTILRVLTDVWLPDFKFGPGRCAMTLAKTPWYWETVTGNLLLLRDWGEDLTIRHLVMPGHVACCTYPVLDWIAEHMPEVPVNVMDQYRPDNFCDPHSAKYRPQYAAIARRPKGSEIRAAYRYAERLGLNYETVTFDRYAPERQAFMPGI